MTTASTTYLDRAIAGELDELRSSTAGRNNKLFVVAARLYAFVEAGASDEQTMSDLLTTEGLATGLHRDEVRSTLKSARKRATHMSEADRQALAAKCQGQRHTAHQTAPSAPELCEAPGEAWQATGAAFAEWAKLCLWASQGAMNCLLGRGLSLKTISAAHLGYNPTGRWSERSKWGLAPDPDGNTRMWLPAGIVIPWYAAGELWKLSIRREVVKGDQERYKTISGSANALYNADALQFGTPAMLVEGVFDALAVQQTAGDLVAAVASGTSGARRVRWLSSLALCSEVLISLDADRPGDEASHYWCEVLDNARRHRPYYADPSQMLQDEQDVRDWVLSGLIAALNSGGPAPWAAAASGLWVDVRAYWQGELAAQSGALGRLQGICQARGYDYDATVEALR
jgi:5S rRNA maturation endonuclease (ribonuclease M5)